MHEPSQQDQARGIRKPVAVSQVVSEATASVQTRPDGPVTEEERDQREASRRRRANAGDFFRAVGKRYQGARFENFKAAVPEQKRVLAELVAYGDAIQEHVAEGHGVVLFGPSGTGKDHLLVALAVAALKANFKVAWESGAEFFGDLRNVMDRDSPGNELGVLERLEYKPILVFSDPVPPVGSLTEYQATMLLRLIDDRYRRLAPTWVTMNVQNGEEADKRLGAAIVDRLRDNSLCLFCDWPSYRKPLGE